MKLPVISANDLKWRLRYFLLYRTSRLDKGNRHVRFDASSIGRLSTWRFYERVISAGS